ncbi:LRR receptor-like serine/threonine-protein kinase RPK2 [Tanacetum coccineum]|uniref:LRR receptor-like serine/threonine-protein kinase RPK2 n=1 Tax=Tanacetum coccineum TaxID=301880 RepID=A0ABQ5G2J0_9ASTR
MGHLQKPVYPFHLIWVIFIFTVSSQDSDKSALLEFKSSVKDIAGVLSGWDLSSNSDHCSWIGVTCGSRDARVYGVNITGGGEFTCFKYDMYSLYGFGVRKKCDGSGFKLSDKLSTR